MGEPIKINISSNSSNPIAIPDQITSPSFAEVVIIKKFTDEVSSDLNSPAGDNKMDIDNFGISNQIETPGNGENDVSDACVLNSTITNVNTLTN